jgi:hypothetical protein
MLGKLRPGFVGWVPMRLRPGFTSGYIGIRLRNALAINQHLASNFGSVWFCDYFL